MKFEKAQRKDLPLLVQMVKEELPDTALNLGFLSKRLNEKNVFLMKLSDGLHPSGFIDLELVSEKEALIVLFFIKKSARGKKLGKRLLEESIEFLSGKGIELVSVLVESENTKAKRLYYNAGFRFFGLLADVLNQKTIELLELELGIASLSYVS